MGQTHQCVAHIALSVTLMPKLLNTRSFMSTSFCVIMVWFLVHRDNLCLFAFAGVGTHSYAY